MEYITYTLHSTSFWFGFVLWIINFFIIFTPQKFITITISIVICVVISGSLMTYPSYRDMKKNEGFCYSDGVLKENHKMVEERCYVEYTGFIKVMDIPTEEIK